MKPWSIARASIVLLVAWAAACQSSTSAPSPTAPATSSAPASTPASSPAPASTLAGKWTGTGADSFSGERVTWVLTQSGSSISGTAELNALDPADGTCGSCHKVKQGTLSGTLTGSTLSVSMSFPAGGDVPAPICVASFTGTAAIADPRITVAYTGTDSCEGVYSNGTIDLTRQP